MHIEPGFLAQTKILFANASAVAVLSYYLKGLWQQPADGLRTLLAALFFSLFMQSFHVSVGPSELHFVGAMALYLTLGFIPTLFGFAFGLLLQAVLFEPLDLAHLAVNTLSLALPLIALHYGLGRKLRDVDSECRLSWLTIVKLDASYYSGVTLMVGFWLLLADVATPLSAWLAFASSYLAIVVFEPVFTYAVVRLLKRYQDHAWVQNCFAVRALRLAD